MPRLTPHEKLIRERKDFIRLNIREHALESFKTIFERRFGMSFDQHQRVMITIWRVTDGRPMTFCPVCNGPMIAPHRKGEVMVQRCMTCLTRIDIPINNPT